MKAKIKQTNRGVWFIKTKNCYFVKFCKAKNCFGCDLDDMRPCYNLLGKNNVFILLKKMRF